MIIPGAGSGSGSGFPKYATNAIASSALKHRWKFDDASGNFLDSVGSLNLTASGTLTYGVTAVIDKGVTFGTNGKGLSSGLGNIPSGSAARTIITIFKPDGTNNKEILWIYGALSTRNLFALELNDGANPQVNLDVFGDDLAPNPVSNVRDPNDWIFIAAIYDGATSISLFINGVMNSRLLGATLSTTAGGNFTVGQDGSNGSVFLGNIDEIAVYNRVLTYWELMELYLGVVPTGTLA